MKRILCFLLVFTICFSLSGCHKTESSDKYVGTYACEEGHELASFKLISSGKVIWSDYTLDLVTEGESVYSGEWILDNEQIYIFYEMNYGGQVSNRAFILNVSSDENTLSNGENVYLKIE